MTTFCLSQTTPSSADLQKLIISQFLRKLRNPCLVYKKLPLVSTLSQFYIVLPSTPKSLFPWCSPIKIVRAFVFLLRATYLICHTLCRELGKYMQYCRADPRTMETSWRGPQRGCTRRRMTLCSWTKQSTTTWSSDSRNGPTSSSTTRKWPVCRYVASAFRHCALRRHHSTSQICPCVWLPHCEDVSGCTGKLHKLLTSAAVGYLLSWVKWQALEVDHSSPSGAQVRNAWSVTSNAHSISSLFCGLYNGAVSMCTKYLRTVVWW